MDAEDGFHLDRLTLDGAGSALLFLNAGWMSSGSASLARFLVGGGGGGGPCFAAGAMGGPAGWGGFPDLPRCFTAFLLLPLYCRCGTMGRVAVCGRGCFAMSKTWTLARTAPAPGAGGGPLLDDAATVTGSPGV